MKLGMQSSWIIYATKPYVLFFLGRGEIAVIVDSKNGYMWTSIDQVKPRVIRSNVPLVKVTVVKFPVISTCRDKTVVFIALTGFLL